MDWKSPAQTRTCVVKEGVQKSAVLEKGSHRGDVFKVAVDERGVDERDGLELHPDESGETGGEGWRHGKRLTPNYPFISMSQKHDATRLKLKLTASTISNQPLLRALLH